MPSSSSIFATSTAFNTPVQATINGVSNVLINYQITATSPNLKVALFSGQAQLVLTFNSLMTGGTWQTNPFANPSLISSGTFTVVAVPEPATILLLTSATAFTAMLRKRVKTS